MRIALVSDCYAPRVGGIETQVRNLGQALHAAGHNVTVITATPSGDERGDHVEWDGGVLVRRLTARIPFDLPVNPFAGDALRSDLPGFDVVHIHTGIVSQFARLATDACIDRGIPAIVTWHSHLADATWWYGFANPLRSWAESGIVLTAVSSAAARAVQKSALRDIEVGVLPNLIHDEPWKSSRSRALSRINASFKNSVHEGEAARGELPLRVVTATRLAPRKRVVPLANLSLEAARRGGNLEVSVFGDGSERGRLQALIREGAPVVLRGKVGPNTLAKHYAEADLFVSPVPKEAFGIAALEARACGLPVIYRRGAGIEEFITHGFDGLEVGDDQEMAAALTMLSKHPDRLRTMRQNALTNPIKHTWDQGLETYLDLYAQVASAK
ncbi:MAG: glycosyltransferase family 4 protein [Actinomycetaceae bacterium]|nr:glycosyltransferase family 4 protein [Actinomycetaceae bacterium]